MEALGLICALTLMRCDADSDFFYFVRVTGALGDGKLLLIQ